MGGDGGQAQAKTWLVKERVMLCCAALPSGVWVEVGCPQDLILNDLAMLHRLYCQNRLGSDPRVLLVCTRLFTDALTPQP